MVLASTLVSVPDAISLCAAVGEADSVAVAVSAALCCSTKLSLVQLSTESSADGLAAVAVVAAKDVVAIDVVTLSSVHVSVSVAVAASVVNAVVVFQYIMVLVALGYNSEPETIPELEAEVESEPKSGAGAATSRALKPASLLVPACVKVVWLASAVGDAVAQLA